MPEEKKIKIINFLQDFGCATLEQLQILFKDKNNNFKSILYDNLISKKGNIFIHNTKEIDNKMIAALDVLCKYKSKNKIKHFHRGHEPIYITFLSTEDILYHIIVSDRNSEKGILKRLRFASQSFPEADKLIILFEGKSCFNDIICKIPYMYCTYPNLKVINRKNA